MSPQESLFAAEPVPAPDAVAASAMAGDVPLAEQLRPRTLDDVAAQARAAAIETEAEPVPDANGEIPDTGEGILEGLFEEDTAPWSPGDADGKGAVK